MKNLWKLFFLSETQFDNVKYQKSLHTYYDNTN